MSLIGLLGVLLIGCVVLWAAKALLTAFSIGDPLRTVVYVILVLILLLWLVNALGLVSVAGLPRLRL
jgi:hypothetical protein